jgi:release factor glutamine methyltransferase
MRIAAPPGVFKPISDSWLLADALRREEPRPGSTVLDLCSGSGVLALTAAQLGTQVTAIDLSRWSVLAIAWNAWRNGLHVRARRGDLFEPVEGERFDLVVVNPPYVPSSELGVPRRGRRRAWAAGPDGRLVLDRILNEVPSYLTPGGVFLTVHSNLIGERATLVRLAAGLSPSEVIVRQRGPLGPLMVAQQREGTVRADARTEELIVFRAVRPAD